MVVLIFACAFDCFSILDKQASFWQDFDGITVAPSIICGFVVVASFVGSLVRAHFHRRRIRWCHFHFVLSHPVYGLVVDFSELLLGSHIMLFEIDSMKMISLRLSVVASRTRHQFFFLLLLLSLAQQLALPIIVEHMDAHSAQESYHIAYSDHHSEGRRQSTSISN